MKHVDFYFDFISPYAYLAFEALPQALEGLSYSVDYRPVFFGGLLQHWGQLGPAELEPKRLWTYRHVLWLAKEQDVALQMPASHPFNPLPLLRLALAYGEGSAEGGRCSRFITETVFRHVWLTGQEALDPARLATLEAAVQAPQGVALEQTAQAEGAVKAALRANTDAAIACGVFGVPSFVVDGQVFWGFDALPMLRTMLSGQLPLPQAQWDACDGIQYGIQRRAPQAGL